MIIFGGSPAMVALPPTFAAKISAMMIGTGSNFSNRASSIVTSAKNRSTVMLSMNIERKPASRVKTTSIAITLYLTNRATYRQIQRKKPTLANPSTIIIIPPMKMIVCQFTPTDSSGS